MNLAKHKYNLLSVALIPLKCAPLPAITLLLGGLAMGSTSVLSVLFTGRFIDTAIALANGNASMNDIYFPLAMVALVTGYIWVGEKLVHFAKVRMTLKARERFRASLVEKRARLNYAHIENAGDWDLIGRVSKDPETRLTDAYNALLGLLSLILNVTGVLILLIMQVWWAALTIVCLTIPMMMLSAKMGKESYQADRDMTKIKRVYEYLSEVLVGRDSAEERALFGYGNELNERYSREYEHARKYEQRINFKWFVRSKLGSILFALIIVAIAGMLLQPTLTGRITVGTFMALISAISLLVSNFAWGLPWFLSEIVKGKEYYKDVGMLLAMDETPGALEEAGAHPPQFNSLELKNVRFRYPGTENWVLDGVNLTIEKGKHYAFVGSNGAGKTTLTRLLTGLYADYEGDILLNGKDVRKYSQQEIKAFYSVIYQDFARYQISVKDNIAFQNPSRERAAEVALASVGLSETVAALPNGINTPLGKLDEKGQDLSGGEWQRLAMARAIVNPAPLRILDEPTAALDPISESQVYTEFEKMSEGITTLFISHRLGSTRLANTIFVLEGGKVAESGSHDELMANGKLYSQMYEAQRSWYQ